MKTSRTTARMLPCLLALAWAAPADAAPVLTLEPVDGAISGAAGTTVGWGFTLTNPGSDFAVVTGSDFCVGVVTSPCGNSFGTYADFAGLQFFVVGPAPENASFTQAFDNGAQTGLGSFLINPAVIGTILGEIVLSYDLFGVDPNSPVFNPDTDILSVGNFLTAAASVTVGSNAVQTPEPGSLLLTLVALLAYGFAASRPAVPLSRWRSAD